MAVLHYMFLAESLCTYVYGGSACSYVAVCSYI